MIVEHAVLNVRPGHEEDFVAAINEALPLIRATEGFRTITVSRGIESPSQFILDVEWDSVAAHVDGFRGSDRFAEWKRLTHHFYEPAPVVEHFTPIASAEA
jgi:heme-degrading monooxygenase HmoA